jgi:hypothetical protein
LGNINAITNVFSKNEEIMIIPCLVHLTQAWWRKASKCGLRKKIT